MPGVSVLTATIPGPGAIDLAPGSGYFLAGLTQRGPANLPTTVTSFAQFVALFGPRQAYGAVYDDLLAFFSQGGTQATLVRVVGSSATTGNVSLKDRSTSPGINTIKFVAASPGDWSANVSISIIDSAITNQYQVIVYYAGVQQESWGPFPDVPTAVALITANSAFVDAVNLSTSTSGAAANPAVVGPVSLSTGSDDRGTVNAAAVLAGLNLIGPDYGSGWAALPGYDASLVGTGLIAHGVANRRDVGLSPTQGTSQSAVTTAAAAFRGVTGSEKAGYFWPWIQITDNVAGPRLVPPDGFVAGRRSATNANVGSWQPPAGQFGASVGSVVIGLDPASGTITDAVGDALNDQHVNVIRPKQGIRLYGWRSLSTDTVNFELLSASDLVNEISFQLSQQLQVDVFTAIDAKKQLFTSMGNTALNVLSPYIKANAFWPGPNDSSGNPTDPGYLIDTSSSVNTPTSLAANQAAVAVYVRPVGVAELVLATLTKVPVGTAF